MTIGQHLISLSAGAVLTPAVIAEVDVPDSKEKMIGLLSAVIVQTAIFGLTEFRKWLIRRKREKSTEPV